MFMIKYAQNRLKMAAKALRSPSSKAKREEYESFLNAIMGRISGDSDPKISALKGKIDKAIVEQLEKSFKNEVERQIDISSGAVGTSATKLQGILPKQFNKISNKNFISHERLSKLMSEYQSLLKQVQDGNLSVTDKKLLEKTKKDTEKIIAELESIAKRAKKGENYFTNTSFLEHSYGGYKNWINLAEHDDVRSLIDMINEQFYCVNGIRKIDMLAQGKLFEYIGIMAVYLMNNISEKSIYEAIKDIQNNGFSFLGEKQVKLMYDVSGFSDDLLKEIQRLQGAEVIDLGGGEKIMIDPYASTQKIDVMVTYPDEAGNKIKIPSSFKNYSIHPNMPDMHLVSGTNAQFFLLDESPAYVRKYLNIMSRDGDAQLASKSKNAITTIEQNAFATLWRQRKDTILSFQLLAIYKAITGAVFQRQGVEWLVINNTKTSKLKIVEISEVLNKLLIKNIYEISNYFSFPETDFDIVYQNYWIAGKANRELGINRVAKIFSQLRAQKISVAMKYASIAKIAPTIV